MKITVVGAGWVGLIAAACYSEFGFFVNVVDSSEEKINNLKKNIISIYEPGLDIILEKAQEKGSITFSNKMINACQDSDAIIIALGTIGINGESDSDLSRVHAAVKDISLSLRRDKYVAIIINSTVPVGTCAVIKRNIEAMRPDLISGEHYDIISNPHFLREGSAIHDFMSPNRVILGIDSDSKKVRDIISEIYKPIIHSNAPFIYTNLETAELIRYASTGFVVLKMAFINEIADLCERVGADVNMLIKGVGLDQRIGFKSLNVTPGIGGSSTPRTSRILINIGETFGCELLTLKGAVNSNVIRTKNLAKKIMSHIEDENGLVGKVVTILGLAFKPQTDDIRESPSIEIAKNLLKCGVGVSVYDPAYKSNSARLDLLPQEIRNNEKFSLASSVYDAANQSDALVIMTDWAEFRGADFKKIFELMNKKSGEKPILIDFRNMFSPDDIPDFNYISQGQPKYISKSQII